MTENAKKPRVNEFIRFIQLLGAKAPEGYTPWLLRLTPQGKDPIPDVSWKKQYALVTISQAIDYMAHGGNIGIAGTAKDNLSILDRDNDLIPDSEVKPTLTVRSRSRVGKHGYYWNFSDPKLPNIPTENAGECRSKWQFVVAPGSYVTVDDITTIPEYDKVNAGFYTIENAIPPATITFEELPKIFRDTWLQKHNSMKPRKTTTKSDFKLPEKHSALFDVTVFDIYKKIKKTDKLPWDTQRWASIFHDSKTDANMSMTRDGMLQCWRHNCSFNALQALIVLSKYMNCTQAGTPHSGDDDTEDSVSDMVGDNQAIFEAWYYAKKEGYIPKDDPVPVRAMMYLASKHLHYNAKEGQKLPRLIYNQVIKILEDKY